VFQLLYTWVFGVYSGFVYIYTGSLLAAFALHAQCNFFEFPYFQNIVEDVFPKWKRGSKEISNQ